MIIIGENENKVVCETSTRGKWGCKLYIADDGIFNKIDLMDAAIYKAEMILNKHNEYNDAEDKKNKKKQH